MSSYVPPDQFGNGPQLRNPDEENLRLLAILHYVLGGLGVLCSGFPLIYVAIGIALISSAKDEQAKMVGPIFAIFGGVATVLLILFSALVIYSGRCLAGHRNRMLSLVVAGISCLNVPLGMALGIFTMIVLLRPTVQALYEANQNRPI